MTGKKGAALYISHQVPGIAFECHFSLKILDMHISSNISLILSLHCGIKVTIFINGLHLP